MRSAFKSRVRSSSISTVAPLPGTPDYSPAMARAANSILYLSPSPSASGHPIYILNAAALPDTADVDYDTLLPYVLAKLPDEEDLIRGAEYEVVFFAGGNTEGVANTKKNHPGPGWFIQAYHVLSRAMRKRIQKLYIVHERTWVRVLAQVFGSVASPKFRKKIVHVTTLSQLAQHIDITNLLIPPSAYLRDRQIAPSIHVANASGRRAFSARTPLPKDSVGLSRLPRVLRETSAFILMNWQTEGIFRIPAHVKLKEILRESYDRGQRYIIWKDRTVYLPLPRYPNTLEHVDMDRLIQELDPGEAYGVHLAASVLKFWYSELRQPIFPATCYKDLKQTFGDAAEPITSDKLVELLSPKSEWSMLSATSKEILTRHLIPLLASVAEQSEINKMTAENLAVCFAPTLCCGPDQLEDAKASTILRRLLTAAVEQWPRGLREACGCDVENFRRDLEAPVRIGDYEDPLPRGAYNGDDETSADSPQLGIETGNDGFTKEQKTGILPRDESPTSPKEPPQETGQLQRDRAFDSEANAGAPPLPPRIPISKPLLPSSSTPPSQAAPLTAPQIPLRTSSAAFTPDGPLRRKEVPPSPVCKPHTLSPHLPALSASEACEPPNQP